LTARLFAAAFSLSAVALLAVIPAVAATRSVKLDNGVSFHPATIEITVGDTVKWTHEGTTTPHTVTAKDGSFDSHPSCTGAAEDCMTGGDTFSRKFTQVGSVGYYCKLHGSASGCSGMCGKVVVKAAATPAPTVKTPTPRPRSTDRPAIPPSTETTQPSDSSSEATDQPDAAGASPNGEGTPPPSTLPTPVTTPRSTGPATPHPSDTPAGSVIGFDVPKEKGSPTEAIAIGLAALGAASIGAAFIWLRPRGGA
jgi:plastocyanin